MAAVEPPKATAPAPAVRGSPTAPGALRATPSSTGVIRTTGSHPKPLLASEALMDDLAPREPWRAAVRWWGAAGAVLLGGAAAVRMLYGGTVAAPLLWSAAVVALLVALLPMPYALRGLLFTLTAGAAGGLGVNGHGPAADMAKIGQWSLVHFLAASLLGGALLFRSRYRAYGPARFALALALIASLPFAVRCGIYLARGTLPLQVASGVALVALVLSLFGFTGSESTLAVRHVAAFAILAITGEVGAELLAPHGAALGSPAGLCAAAAVGAFAATTLLGALGVFQLLSWRNWTQARAVDVRKRGKDDDKEPMPSMPGDPWSTEL
jgi:hypothetical protein